MPTSLNILLCNLPSFHKHCNNEKPFRASLKSRHFVALDGIFLFPLFSRKSFFLQIFWRLFCNRKATRETTPRSNRIKIKTCKRLKIIRFPRQSLAHVKTLFSSVHMITGSGPGLETARLRSAAKHHKLACHVR